MPKSQHGLPLSWLRDHVAHKSDDCLLWPFAKSRTGYGNLAINRKNTTPHRQMALLVYGEPPFADADVAHSCGVRLCVNPLHLRYATRADNHADKVRHQTMSRGENRYNAKLTQEEVASIFFDQRPDPAIALEYEITRELVSRIQTGKAWRWFTQNLSREAA